MASLLTEELVPLEAEIRRRIEVAGPMPVAQYMSLCLTHAQHGYYVTRNPLGSAGDFVTSPEISQMFGELIGLWAAAAWRLMGSPESVRLVELGPGRGTMMVDALRAAKVMPEFRKAVVVHMVEISPVLEKLQRQALEGGEVPIWWHEALEEVPDGPVIIVANEFFDALPVHQAVMCADGWHERVVKIDEEDGKLRFSIARDPLPQFDETLPAHVQVAKIGDIYEWRSDRTALEIGRRVVLSRGVALVVDYGHLKSAIGDTFQAVSHHEYVDPLLTPGLVDLTAHVDFQALTQAAESMGAHKYGPLEQTEFLQRLGIDSRAQALRGGAPPDTGRAITQALLRLTGNEEKGMGRMIKAVALADPKLGPPPGFER